MIVSQYGSRFSQYGRYGDIFYEESAAHSWCNQNYPASQYGAAVNDNCKKGACAFGKCTGPPPWTIVGAQARGLPSREVSIPAEIPIDGGPAATEEGLFGLPKWVAWGGLAVAGVGLVALAFSRKR